MPTIIDVKPGSYKGDVSWAGSEGLKKKFSFIYTILGDTTSDTEQDILATTGLPAMGSILRGAWCVNVTVTEIDAHAKLWEAECSFDTNVNIATGETSSTTPTDRTPEWDWDAEAIEQIIDLDQVSGSVIQTAAGEKIPVTAPFAIPVLTITRYKQVFSPNEILMYVNTTNSLAFWGAPPGTALMSAIKDTSATINAVKLRKVTYIIKFNLIVTVIDSVLTLTGWNACPLHQGTYYLNGGDKIPFLDAAGKPRMGNLTVAGDDNGTATPNYLNFARHKRSPFGQLDLGPW